MGDTIYHTELQTVSKQTFTSMQWFLQQLHCSNSLSIVSGRNIFSPGFTNEVITFNALEVLILSKRYFPNPKWELLPCAQNHIMLKKLVSSRLKVSDTSNTSDNYEFHKGSYPSLQIEKQNPQLQSEENIFHAKPTH